MYIYVVTVTYKVPIAQIMEAAPAHREYLQSFYDDQTILFSGIQCTKTGGVIVMRSDNDTRVQELIDKDPFYTLGLASYDWVSFEARKAQPYIEEWIHGK
ncbi:MAG: hypothetical protein HQM14_10830 [SAR324 cluster bacterium]|nr:hypothetical protein [SAR324 cluster bacterium]